MNEAIIKEISNNLNIKIYQTENVLGLLKDGNTIPFIARYRKEATGGLDETIIKEIEEVYTYQGNLLKRKEDIIRLIDEKNLLTDQLKTDILNCSKLVELEDIYRPFKEKKKTKASEAIKAGLEGLAKQIMAFSKKDVHTLAKEYNCESIKDVEKRIEGAKYIIAEWISDNADIRKWIRNFIWINGEIRSIKKKNSIDEKNLYENYYDFKEPIKRIKLHRVLAINRGEKEEVLSVSLLYDKEYVFEYIKEKYIRDKKSDASLYVSEAIIDSYKRLIYPSIEREIRNELSLKAEDVAIDNFADNVENLLLTPPMKAITVLGFDPAFRTGCKLAVVDKTGKMLEIAVIYPHEPKNEKDKSEKKLLELINKYDIDVIAIGNGTASRESEEFVVNVLKNNNCKTKYIIVSEAGASVYSASKLAIKEFPDLDVSERSAISIARRLQDPLSELVKIDPKSIGVGLYQHDVTQKKLDESLRFTVEKIVNQVGVNINTASVSILSYISGLSKKVIDDIIKTRELKGKFSSRLELSNIKSVNSKVYEQAIGFLRVLNGENPLDKTSIHPESYKYASKLLTTIGMQLKDLGSQELINKLNEVNILEMSNQLEIDKFTLEDIIKSLKEPLLDPREKLVQPILKSDILTIDNLTKGMKLQGTVRNVVDFGAFVDIGLKNDGLIHISNMSDSYIKHPSELLSVGDIIDCYVLDILKDKNKVALSLLESKVR